jgi:hypothetical protein
MENRKNNFLTKAEKVKLPEEQKVTKEEVATFEIRRYDLPPKLKSCQYIITKFSAIT